MQLKGREPLRRLEFTREARINANVGVRTHRSVSATGEAQLTYTYLARPTVHAVMETHDAVRVSGGRTSPHGWPRATGGDIFENPLTGKPWVDNVDQSDRFWKPCLKRLGIRQRRCYITRATYATVGLMGGVNPAYLAGQLGHIDAKMLFEKYAKWIDGVDMGAQRRQLAAAMSAEVNELSEVVR